MTSAEILRRKIWKQRVEQFNRRPIGQRVSIGSKLSALPHVDTVTAGPAYQIPATGRPVVEVAGRDGCVALSNVTQFEEAAPTISRKEV